MGRFIRLAEAMAVTLLSAWFFVPAASGADRTALTGHDLWSLLSAHSEPWAGPLLGLVWILPLVAVYRLVAAVLPESWPGVRPEGVIASIARALAGAVLVAATVVPVVLWGDTADWFASIPLTSWGLAAWGAAVHLSGTGSLLVLLENRDPRLKEYLEFGLTKIRSKLLAAFIGLIAFIVVILSSLLLSNDEKTILKAVSDGARAQVSQSTAVYKANLGSEIAMYDYLNGQVKLNNSQVFPFRSFGFYTTLETRYWTDAPGGEFPALRAEYAASNPNLRYPAEAPLAGAQAERLYRAGDAGSLWDPQDHLFAFSAPIVINDYEKMPSGMKVKHERLLGLAVLTFDEEVVLAPYVRTRTTVVLLTLLFLYIAIVLVYLVGNFIVTPLLHLRMNVRTVSEALSTMVRGQGRVSAHHLKFEPGIRSRDEIQSLSGEIGSMVTVIRGIIPYISASTLKQAEEEAPSRVKELAFLFTDIRGFTALCEGMKPEEVVTLLNRYLDLETEIILANHGDVDKFVGDEVMAFFDGPNKELNACRAALQIRRAMYEEKALRQERGLPAVEIGIGIHTGRVVFGSVGARDRRDFTSIGDPVNLAARLEGANKFYGSKSLVSEAIQAKVAGHFLCRELDAIAVKGKTTSVKIFELLQETEAQTPQAVTLAREFRRGLEAYRGRRWADAEAVFQSLVNEYHDAPAGVFLDRVREFRANPPPADWDGVYRTDAK